MGVTVIHLAVVGELDGVAGETGLLGDLLEQASMVITAWRATLLASASPEQTWRSRSEVDFRGSDHAFDRESTPGVGSRESGTRDNSGV